MDWETARRWLEIMAGNVFDPNQPAYIAVLQRVEELERADDTWRAECEHQTERAEAAEAKLAKVVAILSPKFSQPREVEDDDTCVECGEWFKSRGEGTYCDPCAQELLLLALAAAKGE